MNTTQQEIRQLLVRFKNCGCDVNEWLKPKTLKGRRRISGLTLELEKKLCHRDLLQEWAFYPLYIRVRLIRKKFGVQMSNFTLGKLYKKNNVKPIPLYISQYLHVKEFILSQIVCARRIASLIQGRANICYFDET